MHASFFQYSRQQHASPFGVASHTMGFLDSRVAAARAITRAFDEMLASHRGHALQILHTKHDRIIHHAVNHQPMLIRIDVRHKGAARSAHIVERGGGDLTHRILQRCSNMKVQAKGIRRFPPAMGNTHRIHEAGARAIGCHFVRTADKSPWLGCYRHMFMILPKSRFYRS